MYDAVANIYDHFFARSDEAYEFEATQTILLKRKY